METPSFQLEDPIPSGFAVWWFDFAQQWKWVLGSATSGTFGVLLPTLTFLERRKEVATRAFGAGVTVILMMGVGIAWDSGISVWELIIPAFLCSLGTNLLLGMEIPPEEGPLLTQRHESGLIPQSPTPSEDRHATWKLSYSSTLEQLVDDSMALHHPRSDLFSHRIVGAFLSLIPFFFLGVLLDDIPNGWVLVGIAALACITYRWIRCESRLRRRLARSFTKDLGMTFPLQSEWVTDDACLVFRRDSYEMKFSWKILRSFEERDGGIHMDFREAGRAFLPDRVFEDAQERRRWKARIASGL